MEKLDHDLLVSRINARLDALRISARAASLRTGSSGDAIRNVLRGSFPTAQRLTAIANALDCTVAYLVGDVDDPHEDIVSGEQDPPVNVNLLERMLAKALRRRGFDEETAKPVAQAVARYYPVFAPSADSRHDQSQLDEMIERLFAQISPELRQQEPKK